MCEINLGRAIKVRDIMILTPYQSKRPEHAESINLLEAKIQDTGHYDDQIKDVPSHFEVILAQPHELTNSFGNEHGGEELAPE